MNMVDNLITYSGYALEKVYTELERCFFVRDYPRALYWAVELDMSNLIQDWWTTRCIPLILRYYHVHSPRASLFIALLDRKTTNHAWIATVVTFCCLHIKGEPADKLHLETETKCKPLSHASENAHLHRVINDFAHAFTYKDASTLELSLGSVISLLTNTRKSMNATECLTCAIDKSVETMVRGTSIDASVASIWGYLRPYFHTNAPLVLSHLTLLRSQPVEWSAPIVPNIELIRRTVPVMHEFYTEIRSNQVFRKRVTHLQTRERSSAHAEETEAHKDKMDLVFSLLDGE